MTPADFLAELEKPPYGWVLKVSQGPHGYLLVTVSHETGWVAWSALEEPDVDLPMACWHTLSAYAALSTYEIN